MMKRVLMWGTGKIAKDVMEKCPTLGQYQLVAFVDNDPGKQGNFFYNIPVVPPAEMAALDFDVIAVLADSFEQIREQIDKDYPDLKVPVENQYYFYKQSFLKRYSGTDDSEIGSIVKYVRNNGLDIFNYPYKEKYYKRDTEVFFDKKCGLYYVRYCGYPMYFSRVIKTENAARRYFRELLIEQDTLSPHRYLAGEFKIAKDDTVVDLGVAEGNFALSVIDLVQKIYLLEADEGWIEALDHTFKQFGEKVVIKKCFVSDVDDAPFSKLDSIIDGPVDFLKMDIEGCEWDALQGAERLFDRSPHLKCAICSYHSDFDQILIEDFLDRHHMHHSTTDGYMWFPENCRQSNVSTKLRRGIVRGWKDND